MQPQYLRLTKEEDELREAAAVHQGHPSPDIC